MKAKIQNRYLIETKILDADNVKLYPFRKYQCKIRIILCHTKMTNLTDIFWEPVKYHEGTKQFIDLQTRLSELIQLQPVLPIQNMGKSNRVPKHRNTSKNSAAAKGTCH